MNFDIVVAFISGVASIIGARYAIKRVVKYCDEQCDRRLDAFREGLDRGEK